MYHPSNSITSNKVCYQCNKSITDNTLIYRAYDSSLCSEECLDLRCDYIKQIDPSLKHPSLWNNEQVIRTEIYIPIIIHYDHKISTSPTSIINDNTYTNFETTIDKQSTTIIPATTYKQPISDKQLSIYINLLKEPIYVKYLIYAVTSTLTLGGLYRTGSSLLLTMLY